MKKIFLLIALIVFLSVAWSTRKNQPALCPNCNVVFIGIDALQAAHVSHLGYRLPTTPTLDRLATEGFSFSQAISPSSWTVPTFMSIFTSTYPSVHKLVNRYVEFTKDSQKLSNLSELSPAIKTVAEEFRGLGYTTGGFTGDAGVGAVLGYNKGFDQYTDEVRFGGFANSQKHAMDWLDENRGKKFFLFFHGYDTHGQFDVGDNYRVRYEPKEGKKFDISAKRQAELREQGLRDGLLDIAQDEFLSWRNWYDSKIRDADDRLGEFITELEKRKLLDKTIFVIFSDHGTEFFEHRRLDHGHTLYDELIRVPLVIKIPGIAGDKIISSQATTLDIVPTVFDLLGVKPSKEYRSQMVGTSLAPYFSNPSRPGKDVYSETDYRNYTHKRAIQTADGWKLILTLENNYEELYYLKEDPQELDNRINVNKTIADKLRKKLKDHLLRNLKADPKASILSSCLPAYPDQCR